MPFLNQPLNQWMGENGRKNYFMINLHEGYVAELEFKLATPGSAVRRATDCAMELCTFQVFKMENRMVFPFTVFVCFIWVTLTHLLLVDSSPTSLWTSLFPIAGSLISFYYYYVL